jgi:endonuclease-8
MPEGDTIFRTATVLREALAGRTVTHAHANARPGLRRVPDLSRIEGRRIETVEARGKHLLIGFEGGLTLRTHLRMSGSWHRYAPGEAWRRPKHQATVVLETASSVAVCFNAPIAELLDERALERSAPLSTLGPDLLSNDFETDVALARLRERDATPLGEALLDQRAVAGIGNVYKSELAFLAGRDPFAPVSALDDGALRALLADARRLLRANVRGGARSTRPGGGLWVYGRAGRPCRRCGTLIHVRRQGEQGRLTYWCPRCQGVPAAR